MRLTMTFTASLTVLGVSLWVGTAAFGVPGAVAGTIGSFLFGCALIGKPAGGPAARSR